MMRIWCGQVLVGHSSRLYKRPVPIHMIRGHLTCFSNVKIFTFCKDAFEFREAWIRGLELGSLVGWWDLTA